MIGSRRRLTTFIAIGPVALLAALAGFTMAGLAPLPDDLPPWAAVPAGRAGTAAAPPRVESADGVVLRRSYRGRWNVHDRVALHRMPGLLRDAFIAAEDRRFHEHGGADWRARLAAVWQNLAAGRTVRGASTISEQCVRLLYPRSRTPWSRWLEGFDAARLEARFGKDALLEFYLNQVPYAAHRRGVVQAARHYFDRDLDTLSRREMLTLAVLVRAPSRLDPWHDPHAADGAVARLARYLRRQGKLSADALSATLALQRPTLDLEAPHLVRRALSLHGGHPSRIHTTIHSRTQANATALLSRRLDALASRGAAHGAVLVADHRSGAVRAWTTATAPGLTPSHIDAVLARRQPGSTLKPFVYAMALEQGWTAATRILDAPFAQSVGAGQHAYRNYSRVHYGAVSLRQALGSSLNVPAVKALAFVGGHRFLTRLRELGFHSLERSVLDYGDGLALGNGEVTLLELVTAYAALADGGQLKPLHLLERDAGPAPRQVLDAAASSLIADILADARARTLEFGAGGVLDLPTPTAVKTGTSNDHRDAWAVGFDHRHVVGVWIGNLARKPMHRISGATGPALVMRALFADLNRDDDTRPLPLDRRLVRHAVCADDGLLPDPACHHRVQEWFLPSHPPSAAPSAATPTAPRIRQPGPGLRLALDPRLPLQAQRYRFALAPGHGSSTVRWFVNGEHAHTASHGEWLWPLERGTHDVFAQVHDGETGSIERTPTVTFHVR